MDGDIPNSKPFNSNLFFALGICLNTMSSFVGALGDTMVRKAFLNHKEELDRQLSTTTTAADEPPLEPRTPSPVSSLSPPSLTSQPTNIFHLLPAGYIARPPCARDLGFSPPGINCAEGSSSTEHPTADGGHVGGEELIREPEQTDRKQEQSLPSSCDGTDAPPTPPSRAISEPYIYPPPLSPPITPPLYPFPIFSPDTNTPLPPMSIAAGSQTPPNDNINTFSTSTTTPPHSIATGGSNYPADNTLNLGSPHSLSCSTGSSIQGAVGYSLGAGSTVEPFTPTSLSATSAFPASEGSVISTASRPPSLSSNITALFSTFRSRSGSSDRRPLLSSYPTIPSEQQPPPPLAIDLSPSPLPVRRSVYRQPLWLGGIVLSAAICPFFNVCAMEFLPASVVGFAGLQIIFVMVLARTWLREDISIWNTFGALLVIAGLLLVSFFSGRDPVFETLDDFWRYFDTVQAIIFFSITGSIVVFGVCYYGDGGVAWAGESFCGLCTWCKNFQRIMLPCTAGMFGGYAVLSAKTMVMAITSIATQPHNSLAKIASQWKALFIILFTIVAALSELVFLNRSLQKYQAFSVVPIVNSVITLCGAVGGLLVFQEYPSNPMAWSFGLVMVLLGVMALSYAQRIASIIHRLVTAVVSWSPGGAASAAADDRSVVAAVRGTRLLSGGSVVGLLSTPTG
eukprot:GHVS01015284.1.p1 GENE.GHVS01015284.1~~GHVS01015284.1.p1  ORF type:complete len:681 (+),score=97.35 GHVS01015284.1:169-2211(+)